MKKTKILLIAYSILYLNASIANPNFVITSSMHMDQDGKLIQPDKIFLSKAIKAYRAGYDGDAFTYFKKAAALGNSLSYRYIGLMYINAIGVGKDLVKGYAWLKLAANDKSPKHIKFERQVYNLLTKEQRKRASIEYKAIDNDYGAIAALTRRDRWVHKQKMKMTGTRTGSLAFAPINFDSPRGNGFYNQIQAYVDDYHYGYVTTGEIIPVDDDKEKTKK